MYNIGSWDTHTRESRLIERLPILAPIALHWVLFMLQTFWSWVCVICWGRCDELLCYDIICSGMISQLFQYFTQNRILVLNRRVPSHWISEIIIINININVEGHEVVDRFIISQTTAECRLSSVRLTMVTACYRYFVVSVTIW